MDRQNSDSPNVHRRPSQQPSRRHQWKQDCFRQVPFMGHSPWTVLHYMGCDIHRYWNYAFVQLDQECMVAQGSLLVFHEQRIQHLLDLCFRSWRAMDNRVCLSTNILHRRVSFYAMDIIGLCRKGKNQFMDLLHEKRLCTQFGLGHCSHQSQLWNGHRILVGCLEINTINNFLDHDSALCLGRICLQCLEREEIWPFELPRIVAFSHLGLCWRRNYILQMLAWHRVALLNSFKWQKNKQMIFQQVIDIAQWLQSVKSINTIIYFYMRLKFIESLLIKNDAAFKNIILKMNTIVATLKNIFPRNYGGFAYDRLGSDEFEDTDRGGHSVARSQYGPKYLLQKAQDSSKRIFTNDGKTGQDIIVPKSDISQHWKIQSDKNIKDHHKSAQNNDVLAVQPILQILKQNKNSAPQISKTQTLNNQKPSSQDSSPPNQNTENSNTLDPGAQSPTHNDSSPHNQTFSTDSSSTSLGSFRNFEQLKQQLQKQIDEFKEQVNNVTKTYQDLQKNSSQSQVNRTNTSSQIAIQKVLEEKLNNLLAPMMGKIEDLGVGIQQIKKRQAAQLTRKQFQTHITQIRHQYQTKIRQLPSLLTNLINKQSGNFFSIQHKISEVTSKISALPQAISNQNKQLQTHFVKSLRERFNSFKAKNLQENAQREKNLNQKMDIINITIKRLNHKLQKQKDHVGTLIFKNETLEKATIQKMGSLSKSIEQLIKKQIQTSVEALQKQFQAQKQQFRETRKKSHEIVQNSSEIMRHQVQNIVQVSEQLKLQNKKIDEYQSLVLCRIDGFHGVVEEKVSSIELKTVNQAECIQQQYKQLNKLVIGNYSQLERKLDKVQKLSQTHASQSVRLSNEFSNKMISQFQQIKKDQLELYDLVDLVNQIIVETVEGTQKSIQNCLNLKLQDFFDNMLQPQLMGQAETNQQTNKIALQARNFLHAINPLIQSTHKIIVQINSEKLLEPITSVKCSLTQQMRSLNGTFRSCLTNLKSSVAKSLNNSQKHYMESLRNQFSSFEAKDQRKNVQRENKRSQEINQFDLTIRTFDKRLQKQNKGIGHLIVQNEALEKTIGQKIQQQSRSSQESVKQVRASVNDLKPYLEAQKQKLHQTKKINNQILKNSRKILRNQEETSEQASQLSNAVTESYEKVIDSIQYYSQEFFSMIPNNMDSKVTFVRGIHDKRIVKVSLVNNQMASILPQNQVNQVESPVQKQNEDGFDFLYKQSESISKQKQHQSVQPDPSSFEDLYIREKSNESSISHVKLSVNSQVFSQSYIGSVSAYNSQHTHIVMNQIKNEEQLRSLTERQIWVEIRENTKQMLKRQQNLQKRISQQNFKMYPPGLSSIHGSRDSNMIEERNSVSASKISSFQLQTQRQQEIMISKQNILKQNLFKRRKASADISLRTKEGVIGFGATFQVSVQQPNTLINELREFEQSKVSFDIKKVIDNSSSYSSSELSQNQRREASNQSSRFEKSYQNTCDNIFELQNSQKQLTVEDDGQKSIKISQVSFEEQEWSFNEQKVKSNNSGNEQRKIQHCYDSRVDGDQKDPSIDERHQHREYEDLYQSVVAKVEEIPNETPQNEQIKKNPQNYCEIQQFLQKYTTFSKRQQNKKQSKENDVKKDE